MRKSVSKEHFTTGSKDGPAESVETLQQPMRKESMDELNSVTAKVKINLVEGAEGPHGFNKMSDRLHKRGDMRGIMNKTGEAFSKSVLDRKNHVEVH